MQIIRGLHSILTVHKHCVTAIGNFDGVHRGHQVLIEKLHNQARFCEGPVCVVLFEPQPAEYFLRKLAPARISSFREKIMLLESYGVDQVLCLTFGERLRKLEAGDFVKTVLVDSLAIKFLVLGDDFRFGHKREGEVAHLKKMGRLHGFNVCCVPGIQMNGNRVSSSFVRSVLKQGDICTAQDMLGHPFSMIGRVVVGRQLGRELGFPTANVLTVRRSIPVSGVFIVRVNYGAVWYYGVANIGFKPTFNIQKCSLEIYLMDFKGCLYGKFIRVVFIQKIRDEQRFQSRTLLKDAIKRDVQYARNVLTLPA